MATQSAAQAQQMLAEEQVNNLIIETSLKQYARMECISTPGQTWTYALDTPGVTFQLKSASRSIDHLLVWFNQIPISVTVGTAAGAVKTQGHALAALLGQLEVRLGNTIYGVRASLIPIIARTFESYGTTAHYAGRRAETAGWSYSDALYGSVNGSTTTDDLQTGTGTNTWSGFLKIPMAWLIPINDSLGVSPSLSGSPLTLMFSTPSALAGSDPAVYPVYATGTGAASLGGSTGKIEVFCHFLTGLTPSGSSPTTPDGIVGTPTFGAGIEIRERVVDLPNGVALEDYFQKFQEGTGQKELLKSIWILDNPGEVAGQFAKNENFTRADLMYDSESVAVEYSKINNPSSFGWIVNKFYEQRQMYGDLEPGVLVYDFLSGTDPRYPNNFKAHFNLLQKPDAGVRISYTGTMQTGAKLRIVNLYGRTNLYTAQPGR